MTDELFWRKDGTSLPVEYTSTPIRDDEDNLVGQSDFTSTKKGQNHDKFFYYFASQQRV